MKALMKIAGEAKVVAIGDKKPAGTAGVKEKLKWDPGVKHLSGTAIGAGLGAGAGLVTDLATMNPTFASTQAGATAGSLLGGMVGQQMSREQLRPLLEATDYGRKIKTDGKPQLQKAARLATPAEKERSRRYRAAHRTEISRKAKIRHIKTKAGVHMPRKRLGTAAGGYSFGAPVRKQTSSRKGARSATSQTAGVDFDPYKIPHGTDRTERLAKVGSSSGFRKAMLDLKGRHEGGAVKSPPKGDPALNSFRLSKGPSLELPHR